MRFPSQAQIVQAKGSGAAAQMRRVVAVVRVKGENREEKKRKRWKGGNMQRSISAADFDFNGSAHSAHLSAFLSVALHSTPQDYYSPLFILSSLL
jgi:hypothetical protein